MDFRPEKKLKSARGTLDYLRVSTYFNTSKKNQINDSHCGSSTQVWLNMLKIGMEISETFWNQRSRRWFTGGATQAPKCMPKALESSKDEICPAKICMWWALSQSPHSMHSGQLCLWGHQNQQNIATCGPTTSSIDLQLWITGLPMWSSISVQNGEMNGGYPRILQNC